MLKFIWRAALVPSVAIREGVLKNLEITADHFRALYNNLPFEWFVYDAKKVNRLRHFATSNTLQILVINIDAFRKNFTGSDDEQKSNVIYKESDKLSGRQPIEFVQAARPVVIIDEPQSVDNTDKAQEAIKALNPLMTLRYSATHRNPYNLIYRLDPVRERQRRPPLEAPPDDRGQGRPNPRGHADRLLPRRGQEALHGDGERHRRLRQPAEPELQRARRPVPGRAGGVHRDRDRGRRRPDHPVLAHDPAP